jgi:hypothetical protein
MPDDDFWWLRRRRRSAGGGVSLAVEAGGEDYTITGPLNAFTVTIASGAFAGTYPTVGTYDEADFIGAAPLILADPIRTGTLGVGNLQTAVLAPVLYDASAGALEQTALWEKSGSPVSTALTYTQQSGDDAVGVQFKQTAISGYGSANSQIDAIPVPAYTPNGIVFVTGREVKRTGGFAAANGDTMLIHACFRPTVLSPAGFLMNSIGNALRLALTTTGAGIFHRVENASGGTIVSDRTTAISPAYVVGDVINVLLTLDVRSALGTNLGQYRNHINVNGTLDYTDSVTTLATNALIDMVADLVIGRSEGGFNPTNADVFRLAVWTGITVPDITNSAIRAQFYDAADGAPKAIAAANALIGASPTIKLAETAAGVNALTNDGTLSAFTSKVGTFTDVAF